MNKAYFDYAPVGNSVFVMELEGQEPKQTTLQIQDIESLLGAISAFIATNNIEQLYCNKPAIGLSSSLTKQLVTNYGFNKLTISEYQ